MRQADTLAGLDALDRVAPPARPRRWPFLARSVVPPVLALVAFVAVWLRVFRARKTSDA